MRKNNLRAVAGLYRKKFEWCGACVYCGEPADSLDHVLAVKWGSNVKLDVIQGELKQALRMVPACMECNSLAGADFSLTIRQKRKLIQKKLRKKYNSFLRMPDWNEDELNGLRGRLKQSTKAALVKRAQAWDRVTWPSSKTKSHWSLKSKTN